LLVDPKQAARLLGIGRTTLYELIGGRVDLDQFD
jgi:predicted DNA-binding transcriptional regulator AlpA